MRGPQVDLMVMPPGEAGTYRIHFTGSKEHNVRLRRWPGTRAGACRRRVPADRREERAADRRRRRAADVRHRGGGLRLPRPALIAPELREDAGEIEAALAGRLPKLIEQADLRGDLHSHSDWSDGHQPIEVMAEHARRRGYAYQVLTDHSQSLAIGSGGLTPDRVAEQAESSPRSMPGYAAEEAAGTAPLRDPGRRFPAVPR